MELDARSRFPAYGITYITDKLPSVTYNILCVTDYNTRLHVFQYHIQENLTNTAWDGIIFTVL